MMGMLELGDASREELCEVELEDRKGMYWARMEEIKALVEPLPFVPAIWIAFKRLKSEGWRSKKAMHQLGLHRKI